MDTMTNPTTRPTTTGWTLLSSYGAAPTLADVEFPPHGTSASCGDAGAFVFMGQPGTGVVRHPNANAARFTLFSIKDVRPGSRAWSPPV